MDPEPVTGREREAVGMAGSKRGSGRRDGETQCRFNLRHNVGRPDAWSVGSSRRYLCTLAVPGTCQCILRVGYVAHSLLFHTVNRLPPGQLEALVLTYGLWW